MNTKFIARALETFQVLPIGEGSPVTIFMDQEYDVSGRGEGPNSNLVVIKLDGGEVVAAPQEKFSLEPLRDL